MRNDQSLTRQGIWLSCFALTFPLSAALAFVVWQGAPVRITMLFPWSVSLAVEINTDSEGSDTPSLLYKKGLLIAQDVDATFEP